MTSALRHAPPSPRIRRGFAWLTRRMLGKSFRALHITPEGNRHLQAAAAHAGPVLLIANHTSWWDPMLALHLAERPLAHRPLCAPIEMQQYQRFGILRKIGLFGIDRDHPDALASMVEHVRQRIATERNTLVCITPQGTFADVRTPVRLRPGAAALAMALPEARVLAVALEYGFWLDKRPEVFMHVTPCDASGSTDAVPLSTPQWHRRLTRQLQAAMGQLAPLVIDRDPAAFEHLPGDAAANDGTAVNPWYDAWLRLRGAGTRIGDGMSGPRHTPEVPAAVAGTASRAGEPS